MFCIVRRECLWILRQRRSLFRLGTGLLVLSGALVLAWMAVWRGPAGFRPPDMGRSIFIPIAFLQLLLLLGLAGPASQAICIERERETWDLLIASPLGPWKILLGKMLSSLLFMLLVYVSFLPILALCFLLGGLSARDLIGTYAILGGTAFLVSVVSLFCSSYARSSVSAVRASSILVVLYSLLLPWLPALLMVGLFGRYGFPGLGVQILLSPVYSLIVLLVADPGFVLPPSMLANPHVPFLLGTLLVCLLLLVLTSRRVRLLGTVESAPLKTKRRPISIRERQSRQLGMSCGRHAVWAKERTMRGARHFTRPMTVCLALLVAGGLWGVFICSVARPPSGLLDLFKFCSIPTLIVICLFSPAAPAAAIARERDRKTWDLLRVSVLRSRSIVLGKVLAAVEYLLTLAVCFSVALYIVLQVQRARPGMAFVSLDHLRHLAFFALLAASCTILYVCAGVYFSARARSSAAAYSYTLALVVLHAVGGFIFLLGRLVVMLAVLHATPHTNDLVYLVLVFSTPFGLLIDDAPHWGPRSAGWATLVLTHCAGLLVLAGLFIYAAIRRIDEPDT